MMGIYLLISVLLMGSLFAIVMLELPLVALWLLIVLNILLMLQIAASISVIWKMTHPEGVTIEEVKGDMLYVKGAGPAFLDSLEPLGDETR